MPPEIDTLSPANNATLVTADSVLTATFSETVVLDNGGTVVIQNVTDGTSRTITLPNAQVSVSGEVVTITPSVALDYSKTYAVLISADAVSDMVGLPFAGIANTTTWRFSTHGAPGTTTFSGATAGPGGAGDTWNAVANWDNGIPVEGNHAIIAAGAVAGVVSTPLEYSGNLTLQEGAGLWFSTHSASVLPDANRTLTLVRGSSVGAFVDATFYAIAFDGAVMIQGGTAAGAGVGTTHTFAGPITGTGWLTLGGVSNNTFVFTIANPQLAGGVRSYDLAGQKHRIRAEANGAFGTASVTIQSNCSLILAAGLGNAISDERTLVLSGSKDADSAAKVVLNSSETVKFLVVNGQRMNPGTYGATGSGATNIDDTLFSGTGVLTVLERSTTGVVRFR